MTTHKMVDGVLVPLTPAEIKEFEDLANLPPLVLKPPPPVSLPPEESPGAEVLFDHENRLRALEGEPPMSQSDFGSVISGVPVDDRS